jgi:tRNA nucleotidyltransferase (CCA-adding enzyme)
MQQNNIRMYEVGGTIRDRLLGIKNTDHDFCVIAESYAAMKTFLVSKGAHIYMEKEEFLTLKCRYPGLGNADFVLGRKDGFYTDGRRPDSVHIVDNIEDELSRRDFTMNAMAVDMGTTKLIDPFDGQNDIKNKCIRFVGDPQERLMEDRLRAFRALRFAVTKRFNLHFDTKSALNNLQSFNFQSVSTSRIREEIFKMFKVDTKKTFSLLFVEYPQLGEVIIGRDIWFKPTTETR